VQPLVSITSGEAPHRVRRLSMQSVWPLEAAQWRAVKPSLSGASTAAFARIKARTALAEPALAAQRSGWRPSPSSTETTMSLWASRVCRTWRPRLESLS
jgi:hypothetical protein